MKAYFIGGGIGSLAGAAFLIRDAQLPGRDIMIYEAQPLVGGSLDGALLANRCDPYWSSRSRSCRW